MIKKIGLLSFMLLVLNQSAIANNPIQTGKSLWDQRISIGRSCADCHGKDLTRKGKHVKTNKVIKPMALSVNPKRYTKPKKIEKWFKRNCKWTWGRECTALEKDQMLQYLKSL